MRTRSMETEVILARADARRLKPGDGPKQLIDGWPWMHVLVQLLDQK
jgi:hypothetical protein